MDLAIAKKRLPNPCHCVQTWYIHCAIALALACMVLILESCSNSNTASPLGFIVAGKTSEATKSDGFFGMHTIARISLNNADVSRIH
jgi:hypothetical protein